jgi:hypothetical protein
MIWKIENMMSKKLVKVGKNELKIKIMLDLKKSTYLLINSSPNQFTVFLAQCYTLFVNVL